MSFKCGVCSLDLGRMEWSQTALGPGLTMVRHWSDRGKRTGNWEDNKGYVILLGAIQRKTFY